MSQRSEHTRPGTNVHANAHGGTARGRQEEVHGPTCHQPVKSKTCCVHLYMRVHTYVTRPRNGGGAGSCHDVDRPERTTLREVLHTQGHAASDSTDGKRLEQAWLDTRGALRTRTAGGCGGGDEAETGYAGGACSLEADARHILCSKKSLQPEGRRLVCEHRGVSSLRLGAQPGGLWCLGAQLLQARCPSRVL